MPIVSFIGAGPGDPELITLKAIHRIKAAALIIYAGSLVPQNVFLPHTDLDQSKIINSADLTLEETHQLIVDTIKTNGNVARIHTGDPALYGAIYEQMTRLDEIDIDYEIIPGISSAMAAAAALKTEFTVPDGTQTAIFTRIHGKTPVPRQEDLEKLAEHQSTLVIFLSAHKVEEVTKKLSKHFPLDTPAAIAYRVGWPEQKIIRTNLKNMAANLKKNNITRQALLLVGSAFSEDRHQARSVLYGRDKREQTDA
jgi:precorrin-4/cobalt-precorrin-4 C11-methyltransferase